VKGVRKDFSKGLLIRATSGSWIGSLGAGVIGGFFAYVGLNMFDQVFDLDTLRGIFLHGLAGGILGLAAAILVLKILKNEELEEVLDTLQKKIPRTTIFGKWIGKKNAPVDLQKSGEVLVLEPDKLEP
jgi:ammonia channel protein AmtB